MVYMDVRIYYIIIIYIEVYTCFMWMELHCIVVIMSEWSRFIPKKESVSHSREFYFE